LPGKNNQGKEVKGIEYRCRRAITMRIQQVRKGTENMYASRNSAKGIHQVRKGIEDTYVSRKSEKVVN